MFDSKIEYLDFYKEVLGNGKHCTKSFGLAVWLHQQVKVDEKIKQLIEQGQRFNEQSQYVKDLEYKNSKLQQKIDKAIERANHACIGTAMFHKQFNDVINILRGED